MGVSTIGFVSIQPELVAKPLVCLPVIRDSFLSIHQLSVVQETGGTFHTVVSTRERPLCVAMWLVVVLWKHAEPVFVNIDCNFLSDFLSSPARDGYPLCPCLYYKASIQARPDALVILTCCSDV